MQMLDDITIYTVCAVISGIWISNTKTKFHSLLTTKKHDSEPMFTCEIQSDMNGKNWVHQIKKAVEELSSEKKNKCKKVCLPAWWMTLLPMIKAAYIL